MTRRPSLVLTSGLITALAVCGCEEKVQQSGVPSSPEATKQEPVVDVPVPVDADETVLTADDDHYPLTRVCTFNIEDLRYDDILAGLRGDENPGATRARNAARLVAAIDPDILLVNEIEYDYISSQPLSGEAFARLVTQQREQLGLGTRSYSVFQAPSNTGIHSGHDLDRNGEVVGEPGSRGYGNDALGYGEFAGQFAMALLVAEPLVLQSEQARTFRDFRWAAMPDAILPPGDGSRVPEAEAWYTPEMLQVLPLSSKSHWDVPVDIGDGKVLHLLASHPTPPVFDGPEDRNGRRNHDEIRFWGEYLLGAGWAVDDSGTAGGLAESPAVIIGDLNSDPVMGDSRDNPVLGRNKRHKN